jgi:DNA polymerase
VFGEGRARSDLMLVGEQPGDAEDRAGKPFVGPAGRLLDKALEAAGIERSRVYVTNAVKHFKFEPRGKKRLHKKPNAGEIEACKWWLDQELELVKPALTVALGATAARALAGRPIAIGASRGKLMDLRDGLPLLVTIHPSFLLRMPDPEIKAQEFRRFVQDLRLIARHVPLAKLAA